MKLSKYLPHKINGDIPGHVIEDFAKKAGCSIYAVRKWLSGERVPRPQHQRRVFKITGGKVTSTDWIMDGSK